MDPRSLARAVVAASNLAGSEGIDVTEAVLVQNSNKLALRLLPADVMARVAVTGEEVSGFELDIAGRLAAGSMPVAVPVVPEPRVADGFTVTFWRWYDTVGELAPAAYADALHRLHAGMSRVTIAAPGFTDRVAEAVALVGDPARSPELDAAGRELLLVTLDEALRRVRERAGEDQLLHGEPHPGNVLATADGPRFIDFETCCRGPVEFDLAHVPPEVAALYPDADPDALDEARRLVLAMVAAWRWDARDQFPDRLWHGRHILRLLAEGPPWPTLGELTGPATNQT